MPERKIRTETLRAGIPFAVGSVTLLLIERVAEHAQKSDSGVWFSVAKEPYALVVRDTDGIRAVATDAVEVSIEQLREKIPEFNALLASM
jgi:hypothetical protein